MPRPNTRFLRHVIKDTDSHNRALLAKEAAESRARLEDLESAEDRKRQRRKPDAGNVRKRQIGDIQAILSGSKRPKGDHEPVGGRKMPVSAGRATGETRSRREDDSSATDKRKAAGDELQAGDYRQRHRETNPSSKETASRKVQERESRRKRNDELSSSAEKTRGHHDDRRSRRDRSRSPRRQRHDAGSRRERRSRRHSGNRRSRGEPEARSPGRRGSDADEDEISDPLEDLIGPAPPPRHRGRGTIGGAADLDGRFSASYDPKTDRALHHDDDDEAWDDAVEAYRDHQKLRRHQEERMREAGFAEDQIRKSTLSSAKTEEPDVVWARAGETRAWDHGKVVDADGDVSTSLGRDS